MSIRVLLADDQAMVRAGLRTMLESEPEIEVLGEASRPPRPPGGCDPTSC